MARPKTRGTRKIRGRKQKRRTRRKFHKGKKRTTRRKKGGMIPALQRQDTLPPSRKTDSTSSPTLSQDTISAHPHIFKPIKTGPESLTPEGRNSLNEQRKQMTKLRNKMREAIKKKRDKYTPPNVGGTRKRRRRKHKKRLKTKRL